MARPAFSLPLASGRMLRLIKATDYYRNRGDSLHSVNWSPRSGSTHSVRHPHGPARTEVRVNGVPLSSPPPGRYLLLENREWRSGDTLELSLDNGSAGRAGRARV